jgi:cobalt-zinc-cadmium efflux system membrane fusion protein
MVKKTTYALSILGVVAASGWLIWEVFPKADPAAAEDIAEVSAPTNYVELTEQKVAVAGIQVGAVNRKNMQPVRHISGRLDYDQDRHVAIQSACDGILTEILVRPGDQVAAGQVVAVVSSPEVGSARSDVRSRLAELSLATTERDWQRDICDGVEQLVGMIRQGKSPEEIKQALQDDSLGDYREKLVSAYTNDLLARQMAVNSRDAASSGAIPGTLQQQRETKLQTSGAALEAIMEQSLFEVQQACRKAGAKMEEAQRSLEISIQRLNALLGPAAVPATAAEFRATQDDVLTSVSLISPIDGTVEDRMLSTSERVMAGAPVFIIADCSKLWAVADIRERDWQAISVDIGQSVEISSPAIPDREFTGQVYIVGRRFDPTTGAAPLIARLDASDPRLRPGLFIRMSVPTAPPREVLAVSEQAVVVHEGVQFVFIAESETRFRRVDVVVGETENGMTEILSGLSEGDRVAVTNVFKLKSELLLAGEEE